MPADPASHPPAGVGSLWRLRGYLRPHRWALVVMVAASLAGVGLTIAIPLVTKAIIDGPITAARARRRCCRSACSPWRSASSRRC